MRTIKDTNDENFQISESILSSVKVGRESIIKDWVEKNFNFGFVLTPELRLQIQSKTKLLMNTDIPCVIEACKNLTIKNCSMKTFTIPTRCEKVSIIECPNLEEIICPTQSYGVELYIEDCAALKSIDIDNFYVKNLVIKKCENITELNKVRYVQNLIQVENCKKFRTYSLNNEFACSISFYRCPLKYYKSLVVAREFSLENILKTPDIEFEMGNVIDLRITNCNSLENVTIKGQNPQEVVIDNNANLKVINLNVNPTYSLSICNMSNLEKIETPKKLNCHAIFKKINLQPEVKAKSIIVK